MHYDIRLLDPEMVSMILFVPTFDFFAGFADQNGAVTLICKK